MKLSSPSFDRRTLFTSALTLLFLPNLTNPLQGQGQSLSARQIVSKMVNTYRSAQTFQEKTEARIRFGSGGEFVQKSQIGLKKPNLLFVSSQDPNAGTVSLYGDGKNLLIYSGLNNVYTRRTSTANYATVMRSIEEAGRDQMNLSLGQMLSPLSFLQSRGMPREISRYRSAKLENQKGQILHRVEADASPAWLKDFLGENFILKSGKITLWIDAQTYLLQRAQCVLIWKQLPSLGNPTKSDGGLSFSEKHTDMVLNAPLQDSMFHFEPPRNAKQLFRER